MYDIWNAPSVMVLSGSSVDLSRAPLGPGDPNVLFAPGTICRLVHCTAYRLSPLAHPLGLEAVVCSATVPWLVVPL
jgi:hypothetical protein